MSFTFNWVSTPGQNNNFVNGSINSGRARAFLDDGKVDPFDSPLYICIPPISFEGGNAAAATLYDFAKLIATCGPTTRVQNPGLNYRGNKLSGGNFTLNGNPCGTYEFNVLPGGTTLTQATVANLFSDTNDVSTWIVCKGNLTIPASVVLTPTVNPTYTLPATDTSPDPDAKRRLFMVVYVTGDLTFTDSTSIISMNGRGGNTSATGANIGTFNIPIATNIYMGTSVSPVIQSVGATGGAGANGANGNPGDDATLTIDGSVLYTGGGGSGNSTAAGPFNSGAGGSGSAFSGGAGGGSSIRSGGATAGSSLGGAGGNGSTGTSVGGTGNPGGTGATANGNAGTGGILIVIAEGNFGTDGSTNHIRACGINSATSGGHAGGSSGGGIAVLIKSTGTGIFPLTRVNGGTGGVGGSGGSGNSYNYGINS